MGDLGFTFEEAETLRKAQLTLHRWNEQECGDSNDHCSWSIERDEETGKPFRCVYPHQGKSYRIPIADREKGAQKRVEAVLHAVNLRRTDGDRLIRYYQGDPRGCALYIVRQSDIREGESIDSVYTRGIAVSID